jgi:hypothetical protein
MAFNFLDHAIELFVELTMFYGVNRVFELFKWDLSVSVKILLAG